MKKRKFLAGAILLSALLMLFTACGFLVEPPLMEDDGSRNNIGDKNNNGAGNDLFTGTWLNDETSLIFEAGDGAWKLYFPYHFGSGIYGGVFLYVLEAGTYTISGNNVTATITKVNMRRFGEQEVLVDYADLDNENKACLPQTTKIAIHANKSFIYNVSVIVYGGEAPSHDMVFVKENDGNGEIKWDVKQDGFLFWYDSENEGYVLAGCEKIHVPVEDERGIEEHFIIPSFVNGKPVIAIGGSAFSGRSILTSVVIPGTVTSIGELAFNYCTGLSTITLPSSLTSIGTWAFWGCASLVNITLPSSITSIGNSAFGNCLSLESIIIPNTVTSIGFSTFWNCASLENVTIPGSVTSIGNYAFSGCYSLMRITIPQSVTFIDYRAFQACNVEITVPFNTLDELKENGSYGMTQGVGEGTVIKNYSGSRIWPEK